MSAAKKKSRPRKAAAGTRNRGGASSARSASASSRRRVLVWCGAALGALLALSALVGLLLFSPYRDFSAPVIGEPHCLLLRRLATELRKNRRMETATLRFSPEETQLLLDTLRHSSQFVRSGRPLPPPSSFRLDYRKDGGLAAVVPLELCGSWCFGGKLYLSGVLYFEKQNDRIIVDLPELRFGRADLPLPGGAQIFGSSWRERLIEALPDEFKASVKELYPERDGTLVLVYSPRELRRPLKKQLEKVRERSSGELRMLAGQLITAL